MDARYRTYLIQRYQSLMGYIGALLMIIGVLFFVPLLVLPFFPDESAHAGDFIVVALPSMIGGWLLWKRVDRSQPLSLSLPEGMVVVLLIWLVAALMGAIPFMLAVDMNFTQAVFESTSGWTTTGLSVVDVENVPRIVLFYRSLLQMAGGAGFAILALSALTGPAGAGLSAAEGREDQLVPHVRHSASIVLRIYLGYIIVGLLALKIVGMDWFDAVNHAFTAVATGGFSTRTASIGHYDSALVESVVLALMLLGALNFLTAYNLLRRRFGVVVKNGAVRLEFLLLAVMIPLMLIFTTSSLYGEADKAVRTAVFETTSALTGTGFGTVSHVEWNAVGWLILIALMTIGGGSGSTSGGLKLHRVYVMYRALRWEFERAFLPQHAINEPRIWQGEQQGFLRDDMVRRVALYVFLYLAVLVVGTGIIAAHGYSLGESLYEFASTLGTVGMSLGITGADAPSTMLWVQTASMILGRLEFFAVLIGVFKLARDLRAIAARPSELRRKMEAQQEAPHLPTRQSNLLYTEPIQIADRRDQLNANGAVTQQPTDEEDTTGR